MKIKYNGMVIGEVATNRSLTVVEVLWSLGVNIYDPDDAEVAYRDGFPGTYVDDMGRYVFDIEGYELEG